MHFSNKELLRKKFFKRKMSVQKNQLIKFGGLEIVTGVNTVGILYLYYELSKFGADINTKIAKLTAITKRINKNVNVIDSHLTEHLVKHQLNFDSESREDESITSDNIIINETENIILKRIQDLESRVAELESKDNNRGIK